MEKKLSLYISTLEEFSRGISRINGPKKISQLVATKLSKVFDEKIEYAFVNVNTNSIYESAYIDSNIRHILPFFLEKKFINEIEKRDWSIIDSKGIRFLFNKLFNQELDFETSYLIIPRKEKEMINNFSILWGSELLERIDKEDIDMILSVCNIAELGMNFHLHGLGGKVNKELRRDAFELRDLSGIGSELSLLRKEDFFGSILLNVMGRTLSNSAVIILSANENNTEYRVVASRGLNKSLIEKIHFTDKNNFLRELKRAKKPLIVSEIPNLVNEEEKSILDALEAYALIPLISTNGLIGILALGERINKKPYTEGVFNFINIFSSQIVMAIENSRLSSLRHALSRYVSHQLVGGIISNPDEIKLGGDRRKVTVLFADIRGFTSMSEKMKPEDVVDLLNTYLSGITNIVFQYEGTLDKYMGDCVMAVFGAPIYHYNDAERAVIAALDMQKYVEDINSDRGKDGLNSVEIGIGINTGYAISGNMGSLDRMDYTVIGDVVNTASRLEGKARGGQILATKSVYDEVKYLVKAEPLNPLMLKGKEKPVDLYEIKDLFSRKFIKAVEKKEPYIIGHFFNIARDAELIGESLGFSNEQLKRFYAATVLIDIGRIGIDNNIFNKKGKLTREEFEVVKSHVDRGSEYVEKKLKLYKEGVDLVRHHHEFYDGSGYPDGLKGDAIPLWARIVNVVDAYNAMISKRPFREPFREEEALTILEEERGKKYDPDIVDIYLEILREKKKKKRGREV